MPFLPLSRSALLWLSAAACLFVVGAGLRWWPSAAFRRAGFDEVLYRAYVLQLEQTGPGGYEEITRLYLERQRRPEIQAELPPTRLFYVLCGGAWKWWEFGAAPPVDLRRPEAFTRDPALVSLRHVSALFSTLFLALAGVAAWRVAGREAGLAVLALTAFAPLQIHMAQHALIDGVLAFWALLALWALWETFRQPEHPGWLALLAVALTFLVLTKENAFFVYVGLLGLVLLNRWAGFGRVTPALLIALAAGPLLGVVILAQAAGGPGPFLETYRLLVTKASHLDYAIQTGDGPWYRYLVDLLLLSPVLLCLALGAAFCTVREQRAARFALGFIVFTYALMCHVRYGMNLRYATIWDWPLRLLAWFQLVWLGQHFRWRAHLVLPVAVASLALYDLAQYRLFFMENGLYELATEGLLRSLRILK